MSVTLYVHLNTRLGSVHVDTPLSNSEDVMERSMLVGRACLLASACVKCFSLRCSDGCVRPVTARWAKVVTSAGDTWRRRCCDISAVSTGC